MRHSFLSLGLALLILNPVIADAKVFKQALPGYKFQFPRDHASHDDYKTEWWYYTGHLNAKDGEKFGYELTFFRTGVEDALQTKSPWSMQNIYLAHFAVTDISGHKFHYFEKLNRAGVGTAQASSSKYKVTNEAWSIEQVGDKFVLHAEVPEASLHLTMTGLKPPILHGKDGVSQKADCVGCASHYYSMTRLKSDGVLSVEGKKLDVSGLSWMDHEFGSNQLTKEQVGWDWYSIQLNNDTELMLYVMRKTDGSFDANSSGTVIYGDGRTRHLALADFKIKAKRLWKSAQTGGSYPMDWDVSIPSEKVTLSLISSLDDQELRTGKSTGVSYWEGATDVTGHVGDKPVTGQAYVEMTGYAEKFRKNI